MELEPARAGGHDDGAARRGTRVERDAPLDFQAVAEEAIDQCLEMDGWRDRIRAKPRGIDRRNALARGEPEASIRIARADGLAATRALDAGNSVAETEGEL